MKKYLVVSIAFVILAGTSCQRKNDIQKEKDAIVAVLNEESKAAISQDYTRWSETWLQDESSSFIYSGKEGYSHYDGFEEIGSMFKGNWENNPEKSFSKRTQENYKIKVTNESAWAIYDEISYDFEGEIVLEMLIYKALEKVNGQWKIVVTGLVLKSSY